MKITRLRTVPVEIPFDPPIDIGRAKLRSNGCVLVFLESDQGLTGEGLIASLNAEGLPDLDAAVRRLAPLLAGRDPHAAAELAPRDPGNANVLAMAGVTNALYDLRAKLLGVNVSRMLGACRASIPAYHSGGLWISLSIDELQRAAAAHLANGFRAMKMRLRGVLHEDIPRVRAIREAIGPDVTLMADLNQRLGSAAEAIRLGRELEPYRLGWLEEPLAAHDHAGEAQVAAALETPIASGESVYGSRAVLEMLRLRSADVLMPDLQRMGGPGEFLKAAALAEAHDVPVSGHLFPEMSLALLASIPNATILEYMPWASAVYAERLELDGQGNAIVPERPGWGFGFDPGAIQAFRVP